MDICFEAEAQAFTRCVLCPIILLKKCNIQNIAEIIKFSGIPKKEAQILNTYMTKNKYEELPIEKQVEQQFEEFIKKYH